MSIPTISSGKNNYYDLGLTRKYDMYHIEIALRTIILLLSLLVGSQ